MKLILKNYLFIILCCLLSFSWAQEKRKSRNVQIADKYFQVEDYYLATDYYKQELVDNIDNVYAIYQLGECHRLFFDYEVAKEWYARCMELDVETYPLSLYYYALMLKIEGNYIESEKFLEEFLKMYVPKGEDDPYKELAQLHYDGAVLAVEELKKPARDFDFSCLDSAINTESSDFSPAIYEHDSSIVFASSHVSEKRDKISGRSGEAYYDQVWYEKGDSGWTDKESTFKESKFNVINSKFHDGPGVFNSQRDKYYFTRSDNKNEDKTDYECAIYVTKFLDGKWQEPILLNGNINQPEVWNGHPALSEENDTLFFVSKREGGFGQYDIWYSVLKDDVEDNWGEAVNMGDKVNTPYIESYPSYYSKERVLFFTSNGHKGFGGLDVFMANGKNHETIQNVGLPFNSNKDDFHFSLGDVKGYLSSNREGGQGNDDIYQFNIESKEALIALIESSELQKKGAETVSIKGQILDDKGQPREGVGVILKDSDHKEITRTLTDKEGHFVFSNLDPSKDYKVILDDENPNLTSPMIYQVEGLEVIGNSDVIVTKDIPSDKRIAVKGRILDDDGNPESNAIVALYNEEGVELKTTTTDDDGLFVFANLDPTGNYNTVVKKRRNRPKQDEKIKVNNVLVSQVNEEEVNTTSLEKAAIGEIASRVVFESIYFDSNKSKLRPEAKKVLDELIDYIQNSSKKLKIEIHGHTDSQGSMEYNIKLGRKRGNSAYKYLLKKGLNQSLLIVNSVGEHSPRATNDTPEGRQLNRRVEFSIVGGGAYSPKAMVYVVEPRTSIHQVAQKFNMTVDEVKEMNNITSDALQAYRPMRVRRNGMSTAPVMMAGEVKKQKTEPITYNTEKTILFNDEYNKSVHYHRYDGSGYYMVLPRNTLYSIAKICKITLEELKAMNNLTEESIIYAGQALKVNTHVTESKEDYRERTTLADVGLKVSEQKGEIFDIGDNLRYVVKEGDTFYSVCKAFNMGFEELRKLNNLSNYLLHPNMVLKVKKIEKDNQ